MNQKASLHPNDAIYVEDLYHGYLDPQTKGIKPVLTNVDLRISKGEFVCLVGPSGCGKSTLFRLIIGQEEVQRAENFTIFGEPVGFPDRNRGVVFQRYTLLPNLTVAKNVKLGLMLLADTRDLYRPQWHNEANDLVTKYLHKIRLADSCNKYPHELSGGQMQRVSIAQTLVTLEMYGVPKILCMDEPFGALDPGTREDMQVLILELWENHKITIIFVTHDLTEAVYLGTRVAVLSPFWSSDQHYIEKNVGSRIVNDLPISKSATSTDVKGTKEFAETVRTIWDTGFDPTHRSHVRDFNLKHPDSFQTLTAAEDTVNGGSSKK